MPRDTVLPRGESLRRALRWLSDQGRHDGAAIEEAARRFDLSPSDEEFLLRHCRTGAPKDMDIHPLSEDADSGPAREE
jgi:Mor family transcriptional regulator